MSEALLRAYYAAYNALDADKLGSLLAPDVELVSAMGTQTGRDAYLGTYHYMTGQFTDIMTPEAITVEGPTVSVTIHDSLTAKADIADFMGQSLQAGEELVLRLNGRYTVIDGQIARIEISPAA
ncbi:hypothetical protein NT2_04_04650 [Caenibius tardaugens NBRC 16725]|uniref:SnoaL-like domain-containing protein n=1 Tax=Caenibius tardaugens NBRC 16725 TaxID=1219035 RepID=U2YL22_9SPHN|nr:nuclear transport factor 2 family protein [Caenibius tardaugens]AZI35901.1 nuclear transport factor 2 family protein [Caenibius tardaugens NBRC 16725]GAD49052.1 hypothetical protein NT2_04_04650 [Caenibius tardaugens NBRC 16725]